MIVIVTERRSVNETISEEFDLPASPVIGQELWFHDDHGAFDGVYVVTKTWFVQKDGAFHFNTEVVQKQESAIDNYLASLSGDKAQPKTN